RTSDADGLLVFDGLSEGEGRLLFRAKSYHAPVDGLSVRGEVQDLGVLTLSRPVELSGRVESDALAKSAEGLSVYAFRSGAPIAKGVLDGSMEFSLQVPAGPVALVVCRSLQWNPRLPFRGSFLGRQDAVAPATGVVVRCAGPGASVAGVVPSGGSTVTLSRFDEDTPTSFGVPIPRTEDLGRTPVEGDGRFMAPLEPAEDTLLLVESEDRGSAYVRLDGLGTGETIELGELEWTRTELEVLVVDAEGTPVPGAVVTARDRGAESTEETTDEKGVARFELDAGPYGVQVDAGDAGAMTWTLVHLTGPEKRTLSLDLAALLTGQIQSPDGPEADIAVRAQRMEPISNLILSATSKSDGAFAFKPASPGLYRYWVQGQLMGSVRLAPGERKELDLEVRGPSSTVEVRAGGERLTRLGALFVRAAGDDSAQWSTGSAASGGVFETVLPDDELLFGLHANGLGNNQIIVAQGPRPEGPSYSLDLPSTGAEIRLEGGAAQWPAPAVYLVSLDGREVSTHWGPRPELYAEDEGVGTDGTRVVRVPYVEAGAELLIKGLGPDGRRIERTVTVGAAGSTVVPWE
ncbi:MAG: carboxypeptidase regulatory-like domain-containing protein, partial [Planctomycetota bacterium]